MSVVEHAHIRVDPARSTEFESILPGALPLLASAQGWRSTSVHRDAEVPGGYLLQVGWSRLEDHTELFPASPSGQRFADLVGPFFVQDPEVHHVLSEAIGTDGAGFTNPGSGPSPR